MEFWRNSKCITVSPALTRGQKHPFSETLRSLVLLRILDDGQSVKPMNSNPDMCWLTTGVQRMRCCSTCCTSNYECHNILCKNYDKGKAASVPKHDIMKACKGYRGKTPLILDHRINWMGVMSFIFRPLYPYGKIPLWSLR